MSNDTIPYVACCCESLIRRLEKVNDGKEQGQGMPWTSRDYVCVIKVRYTGICKWLTVCLQMLIPSAWSCSPGLSPSLLISTQNVGKQALLWHGTLNVCAVKPNVKQNCPKSKKEYEVFRWNIDNELSPLASLKLSSRYRRIGLHYCERMFSGIGWDTVHYFGIWATYK